MTEPRVEAGDRALETARDVCRELYDRFAMGGWEPQDAHEQCAELIQSAMNAQEREPLELLRECASTLEAIRYAGFCDVPSNLEKRIERLLAERGEGPR